MMETVTGEGYTLYRGDNAEVLPTLTNNQFDLALTDPPYGIDIVQNEKRFGNSSHLSRKATNEGWDYTIPDGAVFDHLFRISRHQIVFGANYFWPYFHASPCYIVWDKRGTLPAVPFADVEFAWASYDRMPRKYTVINHGFIRDCKEPRYHPTQKPLSLMTAIIEDFTKPGEWIIDPFMGSGSAGVAALQTGRRFVGIELDPGYFEIARKRIEDASRAAQRLPKVLTGGAEDYADAPLFAGLA